MHLIMLGDFFVSMLHTLHYKYVFSLRAAAQKQLSAFCMYYNNQQKCIFVQSSHRGLRFVFPQPFPLLCLFIFFLYCAETKSRKVNSYKKVKCYQSTLGWKTTARVHPLHELTWQK